ncbi:MAG TPA: DUF2306 domain-containing protein [Roseiflexaceae bacterium]|jgi:hypothetical protein|nr:DUF2306 domain-containing protein [Roseiflexaceae bacterium]
MLLRLRRPGLIVGWSVMLLLSLVVVIYAVMMLVTWAFPEELSLSFHIHNVAISMHIAGSIFAMALGPFQFLSWIRVRHVRVHRWMGRIYLLGVLVGGLGGLYMGYFSYGGLVTHLGFMTMAVIWLSTGLLAYRAIRTKRIQVHRQWMIRNFATTLGAVTLRIYLPVLVVGMHVPFVTAYRPVAWLCWVPNLVIAELIIQIAKQRQQARVARRALLKGAP